MSKRHVRRFDAAVTRSERAKARRVRHFIDIVVRLDFTKFNATMADAHDRLLDMIRSIPTCRMPECNAPALGGVRPGFGRVCRKHFREHALRSLRIRTLAPPGEKVATEAFHRSKVQIAPQFTTPSDTAAWRTLGYARHGIEVR